LAGLEVRPWELAKRLHSIPHSALRIQPAFQGQPFRGEGTGGFEGAGVFVSQRVKAGGSQWLLLALPISCSLRPYFPLQLSAFPISAFESASRPPVSGFSLSAFQLFALCQSSNVR
jgi:hypothetical protein